MPLTLPRKPYPVGLNTPLSDSIASTWFFRSAAWRRAYSLAPPRPFSSFVHNTTRMVRRGLRPAFMMSRAASHAARQPPPSSIAPWPTSHESMWPLTMTISLGFSRPRISAITLRDLAGGSVRASIFSSMRIGSPRVCIRASIMASSTESAACGIRFTSAS